jgi:hypothetical protein
MQKKVSESTKKLQQDRYHYKNVLVLLLRNAEEVEGDLRDYFKTKAEEVSVKIRALDKAMKGR